MSCCAGPLFERTSFSVRCGSLDGRASELERERDEVRESEAAGRQAYEELEEAYRREGAAHGRTRRLAFRLGLVVVVLLVVVGLLTWRLVA